MVGPEAERARWEMSDYTHKHTLRAPPAGVGETITLVLCDWCWKVELGTSRPSQWDDSMVTQALYGAHRGNQIPWSWARQHMEDHTNLPELWLKHKCWQPETPRNFVVLTQERVYQLLALESNLISPHAPLSKTFLDSVGFLLRSEKYLFSSLISDYFSFLLSSFSLFLPSLFLPSFLPSSFQVSCVSG